MSPAVKGVLIAVGISALIILILFLISYIITKTLLNIALDRKSPKILSKVKSNVMGEDGMSKIFDRIDAAEKLLRSRETERIEIQSRDGLRLVGHLYPAENQKRIIIAMHGWRSTWATDFGLIADFWHDNGCTVLYAEQRAQGESEGEYMTFGIKERYDCLDWINYINDRTDGTVPIYLGGLSMGATTILMTASLKLPESVRGIATDCAFNSPHGVWAHVIKKNLHLPYNSIQQKLTDAICKRKAGITAREYSTEEAMKDCTVPVLFIHGEDDHFVPFEMTKSNYDACMSEKYLLTIPGAEHGLSYLVNKSAYENAVLKFFEQYDTEILKA